jgi:hypothetical protein
MPPDALGCVEGFRVPPNDLHTIDVLPPSPPSAIYDQNASTPTINRNNPTAVRPSIIAGLFNLRSIGFLICACRCFRKV